MDTTPKLLLPILGDEDYANVPLYLQTLAEQVEAQIGLIDDDIVAAAARPYATWTNRNAAGFTVPVSPGFQYLFVLAGVGAQLIASNPPLFSLDEAPQVFRESGVYHLTWSVAMTPVGAITAGSWRSCIVNLIRLDGSTYVVDQDVSERTLIETDTQLGFTLLAGEGMFVVGDDFRNARLSCTLQHSNAASALQVVTGASMFGIRKVSTDDVIEVV